ncbi:MAG: hypothetical protein Q8O93_00655 [bacterium]|nr:hypothetical protein [bacterium]
MDFTCEGEPTSNWLSVIKSIKMMMAIKELNIVSFIVTSIGNYRIFEEFNLKDPDLPVTIYFSLHSANLEKRAWLIPASKGQSIYKIGEQLEKRYYLNGIRPSAAISVFDRCNNQPEDMREFKQFFKTFPFFGIKISTGVNLSLVEYPVTSDQRTLEVISELRMAGHDARYRDILGTGVMAGCGTTVPPVKKTKKADSIRFRGGSMR